MPAAEVLINTPMIRDLLRRGQVHEIKEAMEAVLQEGMQTLRPVPVPRCTRKARSSARKRCAQADSRDGLALKIRLSEGASGEHDPYADVFDVSA